MDRQTQDYSYTQPPQYGYAAQPQNYPQQAYMAPPQFPPYAGPHQQFYPPQPPPPYAATSAPPPFDPELQKRIDKLVEYTAKNGPDFESMIREKQSNNPDYSFLFGGEGYNYYRYKLLTSTSFAPVSYHPIVPLPPYQQPVYEQPAPYRTGGFTGLRGPLPADVAGEVEAALGGLTGTKESIKAAKSWFMQRAPFAPALADALRDRVLALDDPERQLHVIFLANDILFESLQHRANPRELDNEARALLPVLGSMLCRVYHNPLNQEENQSRLMKIVQFWASKQVFDQETISNLEREMVSGIAVAGTVSVPVPNPYSVPMPDTSGFAPHNWQHDNMQASIPAHQTPFSVPIPTHQPPFPVPVPTHQTPYPVPVPVPTQPPVSVPVSAPTDPTLPPYPLFPPGLIPGMVRKTQIGSGVPYSPLSPVDIPTIIPPSPIPDSKIREKVSRFCKEIGEINPSEGEYEEDDERESPVRKGGVSIAPPVGLNDVDPETGMCADGSVPGGTGTGRLGLGAGTDDASSQYDDVYSSYRKNMSTSYHTFMSTRADTRS